MTVKTGALEHAHVQGKAAWPNVDVPLEVFAAYIERVEIDEKRLLTHAPDLFLVVATLQGQHRALEAFDERLRAVCRVAARVEASPEFVDDVRQELRMKLLSGPAPRLASYSGSGALSDWLRVAALRVGLNLKRSDRLMPAPAPELDRLIGAVEEIEIDRRYIEGFKSAIEASLLALTPRERTLLRLHFVDGLSLERIGTIYSAHRATVARWLAMARAMVFERAKIELAERHGLRTADVKSLYRLLEHDVNASVSRLLRA
jgi:RNA polymerase sigma-70 factor, ECF subfamily